MAASTVRPPASPSAPNASFTLRRNAAGVFDAWAREGRAEGMGTGHLATAAQVLEKVDARKGGTFLDVGCGAGIALGHLGRLRPDLRRIGIDAAPSMARAARRQDPAARFLVGDARRLPLGDGVVDGAFTMEVFYYLRDPIAALRELQRVLRPGGRLDLMVDYFAENPYSQDWPQRTGLPMTRWTGAQWRDALAAAGFTGVTSRQVLPRPADLAYLEDRNQKDDAWAATIGTLHVTGRRP